MITGWVFICLVIFLAFLFDFINGFHDAANSIAIMVATKALKPMSAVLWAAFFNFVAFLFFQLTVANTIGAGLIEYKVVTPHLLLAALTGAIVWNILTWYGGLPSSSSHALIGGLIGAAVMKAGWGGLQWRGLSPVLMAIVLSPLLGLGLGLLLSKLAHFLFRHSRAGRIEQWARYTQFVVGACLSLGHGGNDAQKTMGIITVLLLSSGVLTGEFHVPLWVAFSCNFVMGLGTLMGGWRIVETMGERITALTPLSGSCAAASAALTLCTANYLGIPVSTTHTVTGAIVGVGTAKGIWGTHWSTVYYIILAWLFTLPAAALVAASVMWLENSLSPGLT